MKKILIILIFSLFLLMGCVDNIKRDTNTSQNIEETESNIVLNVKWSGETTDNSVSRFIHYDTATIQVVLTKGTTTETVDFVRSSDETEVSKTLKNIETGIWTVDVTLEDSNGEIATKQETVIVVEGSNNITIVMRRGDYSNNPKLYETFYPNYKYNYIGSFFGIHAVASLGIGSIEIGLTDKLGTYETFLPVNMYLPHFDDSTDSSWIATGSGIVGTLTFTYNSDEQITQAVYENTSTYISTTTFTYDSLGELSTEETVVKYGGIEQSDITKTYSYTNGLLTSVSSTDGKEITIAYSDGKLATLDITNSGSADYSENYSVSGDIVTRINYDYGDDNYEAFDIDISTSGQIYSTVNTYTSSTSPSAFATAYYYDGSNIEYSFISVSEGEKIVFNSSSSSIDSIELYYTSSSVDTQISYFNITYDSTIIDI